VNIVGKFENDEVYHRSKLLRAGDDLLQAIRDTVEIGVANAVLQHTPFLRSQVVTLTACSRYLKPEVHPKLPILTAEHAKDLDDLIQYHFDLGRNSIRLDVESWWSRDAWEPPSPPQRPSTTSGPMSGRADSVTRAPAVQAGRAGSVTRVSAMQAGRERIQSKIELLVRLQTRWACSGNGCPYRPSRTCYVKGNIHLKIDDPDIGAWADLIQTNPDTYSEEELPESILKRLQTKADTRRQNALRRKESSQFETHHPYITVYNGAVGGASGAAGSSSDPHANRPPSRSSLPSDHGATAVEYCRWLSREYSGTMKEAYDTAGRALLEEGYGPQEAQEAAQKNPQGLRELGIVEGIIMRLAKRRLVRQFLQQYSSGE